jgi:hypothetical protein
MSDAKTGYICAIDWEYHVGKNWNGAEIFSSMDALKANRPCAKSCGIIRVKVTLDKVMLKGNLK